MAGEVEGKRSSGRRPYASVKGCSLSPLVPTDLPELPDDLYGAGDVGESVYGEKADIRPLLGEGIKGDRTAIMTVRNGWCGVYSVVLDAVQKLSRYAHVTVRCLLTERGCSRYVCTMQLPAGASWRWDENTRARWRTGPGFR